MLSLPSLQQELLTVLEQESFDPPLKKALDDILYAPTRLLGGHITVWVELPLLVATVITEAHISALPAAMSCEFFGSALDICDDLEDGDAVAGLTERAKALQLNAATALLGLAFKALSTHHTPWDLVGKASLLLSTSLITATKGQHKDLFYAGCDPLSVEECVLIARQKGGALFRAVLGLGALYAGADTTLQALMESIGDCLGTSAQIENDLQDAKQPDIKNDLARQVQTIPVSIARQSGSTLADLPTAIFNGGVQVGLAIIHAERARAQEVLDTVADSYPALGPRLDLLRPYLS